MSKIPEYILISIDFVNRFLPEPAKILSPKESTKKLIPFGISKSFDFFQTEIFKTPFLIVGTDDEESLFSPTQLERHKEIIEQHTGLRCIFIFKKATAYLFARYTKKNIDLIIGEKHLFLPSIFLIAGREKYENLQAKEKVPVLFQLIILYHLQRENINGQTMHMLSHKLQTSYATINRCIRWMKENHFIITEGKKEKIIRFSSHGKDLWQKALPYLGSPIESIKYTSNNQLGEIGLISGENALAKYTLLSGRLTQKAISKEQYKVLQKKNIRWEPTGEFKIEIWKYNPSIISSGEVIDKLSLYLLLKDNEDERVQIELENMMQNIIW